MITYDSNDNWFRDILNSFKSETLVKLTKRVIAAALFSSVNVYIALNYLDLGSKFETGCFTLIGVCLSILMVFRTNTAYERWWEGRKQWGNLVNNCRSMALLMDAKLAQHDEGNRRYFARYISNYAFALSAHLRGTFSVKQLYDLETEDIKLLEVFQHPPNYIAKKLYSRTVRLLDQGYMSEFVELKMLDHLAGFNNITGACERIKHTPIPFSYRTFLKIFIFIYIAVLPYIYAVELGYWTVLLTFLEFWVLVGLEMMAEEIEDPFNNNTNDLPTRSLSFTIKNNVYEILGFYEEVKPIKKKELYKVLD